MVFSFLAPYVSPILSLTVLVSNVVFLVTLALFVFSHKTRELIIHHIHERPVEHILFFSLCASFGSLALSNIIGFPPCELCWFQRIAMYPQVLICLVALSRKTKEAVYYLF